MSGTSPELTGQHAMQAFDDEMAAIHAMLTAWNEGKVPTSHVELPDELADLNVQEFVDGMARHFPARTDELDLLWVLLAAHDQDAVNVAVSLARQVANALEQGKRAGDAFWAMDVREPAARMTYLLGPLAEVLGRRGEALTLYMTAADRLRAVDDTAEAILDVLGSAIDVGMDMDPLPRSKLAACLDNRGVVLLERGLPDAALQHFRKAGEFADTPQARNFVRMDTASALLQIGEVESAARAYEETVRALEEGAAGPPLWLALHNLAHAYVDSGDDERAADSFRLADAGMRSAPPERRYQGARSRAQAYARVGDEAAAWTAMREAIDFAVADVELRLDPAVFIDASLAAAQEAVPAGSSAALARDRGLELARHGELLAAVEPLQRAAVLAREADDRATELLCAATIASIWGELGAVDRAASVAADVRADAIMLGLIAPAAIACNTLAGLLERGVESTDANRDAFVLSLESTFLCETNEVCRERADADILARVPLVDAGAPTARLAEIVGEFAPQSAVELWLQAIAWAERVGNADTRASRTAALLQALIRAQTNRAGSPDGSPDVRTLERELEALLERGALGDEARLRCHLALSLAKGARDRSAGLDDLREAARLLESRRVQYELAGAARAAADIDDVQNVYGPMLATLSLGSTDHAETFEVLQRTRARALLTGLAERAGNDYEPPRLGEAISLIEELPTPTTLVDLATTPRGLRAYILDADGLRVVDVPGKLDEIRRVQFGDVRRRAREVAALVRSSSMLQELGERTDAEIAAGRSLLISCDDSLANLPWHGVNVGQSSWSESRSIGRIPAIGLLRYPSTRARTGRSVVGGDSRGDLPFAAAECLEVGNRLDSAPLLGRGCTYAAFANALEQSPDIVHLAVHGRGDVRRGGRASLLFATEGGEPEWVPFDRLTGLDWSTSLIVFSGCSTAVGGPRNGHGLYGIAQAAAMAGARTTIASLWPVDDQSAHVFMSALYKGIGVARTTAQWIDLRVQMDVARTQLRAWLGDKQKSGPSIQRDGRDYAFDDDIEQPPLDEDTAAFLSWAPFVLIGDPIARFAP